jgi:hypothetical protein
MADEPAIITFTLVAACACGTTLAIAANINTANPALKRAINIFSFDFGKPARVRAAWRRTQGGWKLPLLPTGRGVFPGPQRRTELTRTGSDYDAASLATDVYPSVKED